MTEAEQLKRVREAIFAMANALGVYLPMTPEVRAALDALVRSDIESARGHRLTTCLVIGAKQQENEGMDELIRSIHLQLLAARDLGLVTDRQILDVIKILKPVTADNTT